MSAAPGRSGTFEELWARFGRSRSTSEQLEALVRGLYEALVASCVDLVAARRELERLLVFLASPEGRTDANCGAVDRFLALGAFDWPDLPAPIGDVLADMAGALHDTVLAPEIAVRFESTPELLLRRLQAKDL